MFDRSRLVYRLDRANLRPSLGLVKFGYVDPYFGLVRDGVLVVLLVGISDGI